ncbi:MAG: alpha/beta hydrolase [Clostridia bacterium]
MGIHNNIVNKFCKFNDNLEVERNKNRKPIEGIVKNLDIPYMDDDNIYHLLDVFYPENTNGKLPIIIDIHGGGWIYGTKAINSQYCQDLAKGGFVVVNVSYRLITKEAGGTFPNFLNDIFASFAWVEKNIESFHGDTNNVMLTGDSAGGHLAGMAMSVICDENLQNKLNLNTSLKFRALTLTCPVMYLDCYEKLHLPIIKYLFGLMFGADWKKSEYKKMGTISNNNLEKFPPVFLISSYGDFMRKQVKKFENELKKRAIEYDICFFEKQDTNKLEHVYNIIFPEYKESIIANDASVEFFRKYIV